MGARGRARGLRRVSGACSGALSGCFQRRQRRRVRGVGRVESHRHLERAPGVVEFAEREVRLTDASPVQRRSGSVVNEAFSEVKVWCESTWLWPTRVRSRPRASRRTGRRTGSSWRGTPRIGCSIRARPPAPAIYPCERVKRESLMLVCRLTKNKNMGLRNGDDGPEPLTWSRRGAPCGSRPARTRRSRARARPRPRPPRVSQPRTRTACSWSCRPCCTDA